MLKPEIGIAEKNLKTIIHLLSMILADEVTLYTKTRKFHWNVAGESFMEMHKIFEDQYTALEATIDSLAERINKLGGKTIGTMKEFIELTRIKESPGEYPTQIEMVKELLNNHEMMAKQLRKDIEICSEKDVATADLLTGIIAEHETTAWILRRYLS